MTTSSPVDAESPVDRIVSNIKAAGVAGVTGARFGSISEDGLHVYDENGVELVNFVTCSYLGIGTETRVRDAAKAAIDRYGIVLSSSPMYAAVGLYTELTAGLEAMTGGYVSLGASTTLTSMGSFPVLMQPGCVVFIDEAAHASLQYASRLLAPDGIPVVKFAHNDLSDLAAKIAEIPATTQIWVVVDGVYSMLGDTAPLEALADLADIYPNMWLYIDDAHGFSWTGPNGCGLAISRIGIGERRVFAAGLAKSFGTNGGILVSGTEAIRDRVSLTGPTFTFSGPIPVGALGAGVESTKIHLDPVEHSARADRVADRIADVYELADVYGVDIADRSPTPVFLVRCGRDTVSIGIAARMRQEGFFVNPGVFPAVERDRGGVRFTVNASMRREHVEAMLATLAGLIAASRD